MTTAPGRALDFLPAVLVAASLLGGSGFSRYYLRETSRQFMSSFEKQNAAEIEAGDVFALATRLNSVSASVNWTCISAYRGDHRFFHQQRGPCGAGLLRQPVAVYSPNNQGLRIDFTLRLPRTLEIAAAGFLALQTALLALLFLGVRRVERLKSEGHRRISELATQVAHDIRSPLAALEALLGRMAGLAAEDQALVRDAIGRIHAVSVDLLNRNRAETGTRPPAPTELSALVSRLLTEKRLQAPPEIALLAGTDGPELWAMAEPADLERVLSNLVENCMQALKGGGTVDVRLEPSVETVAIVVLDRGPGISPDVLQRLGKRGATFGKEGGNGLGLWHAKTTVESWGGRLEIESEVGKGTTVRLILPRAEAPPFAQAAGGGAAVLIDDDPLVRMNWTVAAKRAGKALKAYPDAASFVKEAGECARETPIYIDSDLGEGMKGEDAAKELLALGFTELRLATGHDPASFPTLPHIKAIQGKEPPWPSA